MIEILEATRADLPKLKELLTSSCPFDPAHKVAEEKLFGRGADAQVPSCRLVRLDGVLVGVGAVCGATLRLLAVHPDAREQGVGSALLTDLEAQTQAPVRVLAQPGNYLAPGVDVRNVEAIEWLIRRGYTAVGSVTNLLLPLEHPAVTLAKLAAQARSLASLGYRLERANVQRAQEFAPFISSEFSQGWSFECLQAARVGGLHVATLEGSLAAFAAHDGNNQGLGWFGPTATLPEHRGQGLARALLIACLLDVRAAGHSHCEVSWIGPREFYQKSVAIAGERTFTQLRKES